jgi:hypothetical protein
MAKVVTYKMKEGETMFGSGSGVAVWRPYRDKQSIPAKVEPEEIPEHLKPYDMKGQPLDLQNLPFDPAEEAMKEGQRWLLAQNKETPAPKAVSTAAK